MSQGLESPTIVCSCGKRLKASGAIPGRLGRCPACGAEFRVPETSTCAPSSVESPAPIASKARSRRPKSRDIPEPPATAYDVLPERASASTAFVASRIGASTSARDTGPVGRGGLVRVPDMAREGLGENLLYPVWDLAGIAWLMVLSLAFTFTGSVVFGLIPMVLAGGNIAVMGAFAFGMIIPFLFTTGYTCLVLGEILISSSAGEVVHPRWPDIDLYAILGGLFRWSCALAPGIAMGVLPAWSGWTHWSEVGILGRLTLAFWLSLGVSYSLMSLLSVLLHDDLRAADPRMVLRGIRRVGLPYLGPCGFAVVSILSATIGLEIVYQMSNFFLIILAAWLFCGMALYELMVLIRLLGVTCYKNASKLGWFPERQRWGVRG
jgi:hypothetical protein